MADSIKSDTGTPALTRSAMEDRTMADMKSSFLATMSHEIRTPMQSVYGLLELIAEEPMSDNARGMLATAKKSAAGLLEILDDILDLAKVEAGKVELDNFEIPVRTLAYGVLECLEVRLMGKPVKLIADIAPDVPFVVMGDPTRLRQILINLVGNSVKFTDQGNVTLKIFSKSRVAMALSKDGNDEALVLRFEIVDTGIGMSQEVAQRLFRPFMQADSSTTRKFGGTGLGLSISHKLIELMGGKVGVESEPGKGSTFWFEIPTFVATEQRKVDLPSLEGIVVLSVEDHPKGAKEIYSALSSMGAKVESAGTYAEGLDLVSKRPFDVAVVDQGLPDGLGIDLLKEMSRLRPFMGMILYSVRDDFGVQYTTKVIGAKFLSKPASRLGLGDAVKAAALRVTRQTLTGPRRLLIAEDTESVRDVLKRQLDKLGVEADFVNTGAEAARALEESRHGILLTDLHMPDMDGYQLVAHIRALEDKEGIDQHRRFPVIVLTADVQMAQRQAYLSYGFDECLLKPVTLGQFRQLLVRWGILQDAAIITGSGTKAPDAAAGSAADAQLPPAIDRTMLIEHFGVIDASTIEMMKMFIKMTRPQIEKIETAFAEKNNKILRDQAHSLKGAARSACCKLLGNLAEELQKRAEDGGPVTQTMIDAIKIEFERVEKSIEALKG